MKRVLEETKAVLLHRPGKSLVGGKTEGSFTRLRNRNKKTNYGEDENIVLVFFPNIAADIEVLPPLKPGLTDR